MSRGEAIPHRAHVHYFSEQQRKENTSPPFCVYKARVPPPPLFGFLQKQKHPFPCYSTLQRESKGLKILQGTLFSCLYSFSKGVFGLKKCWVAKVDGVALIQSNEFYFEIFSFFPAGLVQLHRVGVEINFWV